MTHLRKASRQLWISNEDKLLISYPDEQDKWSFILPKRTLPISGLKGVSSTKGPDSELMKLKETNGYKLYELVFYTLLINKEGIHTILRFLEDFPSKVEYPHNLVFFQNVCKLLEKEYEEVKIDETTYFIFPTLFDIKPPPKLLSDPDSIYACNSRKYIDFTKEMETNFVVLKNNAFKTCKFMELFDQVVEKGKLTEFLTNLAESHLKFSLASDDFDRDKHIIIRLAGVLESHMKNSYGKNLKLPKVLLG